MNHKLFRPQAVVLALLFIGLLFVSSQAWGQNAPASTGSRTVLQVLANVNNQEISRQKVIDAAMEDHAQQVLVSLVNRMIIENACTKANVTVTDEEILAEIDALAKRFSIPKEQYLKMLEERAGVTPKMYIDENIRPQLAVKKLAKQEIQVTDEDLLFEYERTYGDAVKIRIISSKTKEESLKIRAELEKDLGQFAVLAQKYSTDSYTAALGGVVPPLRRHTNGEEIEKIVFSMKTGELSEPVPLADQYLLILCDQIIPATVKMEEVREELKALVGQKKQRDVGQEYMKKLFDQAKIEIVYGDKEKMKLRPGVAASVDGRVISIAVLGNECLSQFGKEALTGVINRTLIEQELKKRKIEITDADIQAKMESEAEIGFPVGKDGKPNVKGWLQAVCQKFECTEERYIRDAIWPSIALEKLASDRVEVTDVDLQNSYEANFGKKVRVRAIVLNDMRTAMRVWELARKAGTEEEFAQLARQYSTEASSRENGGEVPPIAKFSGQPELEEAAFKLKEGELSGVIQVENVCIILLCTGFTEPTGITFDEAKDVIRKDVTYKKTQMAIAEVFEEIKEQAAIENYLEGTVQTPKAAQEEANPKTSLQEVGPAGTVKP